MVVFYLWRKICQWNLRSSAALHLNKWLSGPWIIILAQGVVTWRIDAVVRVLTIGSQPLLLRCLPPARLVKFLVIMSIFVLLIEHGLAHYRIVYHHKTPLLIAWTHSLLWLLLSNNFIMFTLSLLWQDSNWAEINTWCIQLWLSKFLLVCLVWLFLVDK